MRENYCNHSVIIAASSCTISCSRGWGSIIVNYTGESILSVIMHCCLVIHNQMWWKLGPSSQLCRRDQYSRFLRMSSQLESFWHVLWSPNTYFTIQSLKKLFYKSSTDYSVALKILNKTPVLGPWHCNPQVDIGLE